MDLTDEQWEVLEPLLPELPRRADGKGRPWREPRGVLNGILWVLHTGAPWLPNAYGGLTPPGKEQPQQQPYEGYDRKNSH